MIPYEHQAKSIAHLLSLFGQAPCGAVDASDMGTGKTLVAVEVERTLDLPTLVVCPLAAKAGWERTALSQQAEFDVINYEMLRTGRTDYGTWFTPKFCRKPRFQFHDGVRTVIFDEAHRCMGLQTKNSELMRAVRRQGLYGLALSATLADTPMELDALGFMLGLHDSHEPATLRVKEPLDFYTWARRYGCGKGMFEPFEFLGSKADKAKNMARLNRAIFPAHGVRVRIKDLPWFPKTQITAELYELGSGKRSLDELYAQMSAALNRVDERDAECKRRLLERAKRNGFQGDELPDDPLTTFLRARQKIELLKVPVFQEFTDDGLANGMSVMLFLNFKESIVELKKIFPTASVIWGAQTAVEREDQRLQYQREQTRVILCQSDAGGVALDLPDETGRFPRLSGISPGFNAKLLRQIFGRPCRLSSKTKSLQRVIFAAGTEEEPIHNRLAMKLDNLDSLQDGDLLPNNLRFS